MKWISIVLVLIICSSSLQAFGQESIPNRIVVGSSGGITYYAQLTPYDLQVIEKNRYNVIKFSVKIKVEKLPFDANIFFDNTATVLKDENSKVYGIDYQECASPYGYQIEGKQSDSGSYGVCYSVDKNLEKFSILYDNHYYAGQQSWQIGTIDLTQYSQGNSQTPTTTASPITTSTSSTANIFEQLMNWLKQIFHFMVLGV